MSIILFECEFFFLVCVTRRVPVTRDNPAKELPLYPVSVVYFFVFGCSVNILPTIH